MQMNAPHTHAERPAPEDEMIDLAQGLRTLRAGWRTIAAGFAVAVALGLLYAQFLATPVYTARATVVLETRKPQVIDLEGMMGGLTGSSDELNTEVEVLRSRGVAEKVVAELDLAADPEFNATLGAPSLRARLRGLFGAAAAPDPAAIRAGVVDAVLAHLSVRNLPDSYVFEVAVQSEDPQKAARIADAWTKRYIVNQIEVKFEATEQATVWLGNRVAALKRQLEATEEKVKSFNVGTTLISEDSLAALQVQLKDLRERIADTTQAAARASARAAALEAARTPDEKVAAAGEAGLARLAAGTGAEFEAQFARLLARARLERARAEDQLAAMRRTETTLSRQISRQGDDMIALQQLTREAEANRTLYEYFLGRLKETSAQQGIQQADSRILSAAVVPKVPTAPRKGLILAFCAVLGLIAGVAVVLLRDLLRDGFRTARQLEEDTGLVVMGQIPVIPGATRGEVMGYLAAKPSSAAMEAVRNLRTSVLLSNVDAPPQVIMLTSSVPGEGKTTNALALAMNFVGIGKSVLLIEGDIRRNMLAEYFPQHAGRKGLVSLLSGAAEVDEVVIAHPELGLSLIMGERSRVNAADLFMSDAWKGFIAQMRRRFDYILIDTPPVLVVPDARIIAQSADAALFSVLWDGTPRREVFEALQLFASVRQKVSGLILSRIDTDRMQRYGQGGSYGARYGAHAEYYRD
ncbi:chain-length determining protein [Rhodobacter capsulatus YW1]|nr:chain-length determining protein [Rhodobacter capsulatus YW1]